jgi:hypothetical protein
MIRISSSSPYKRLHQSLGYHTPLEIQQHLKANEGREEKGKMDLIPIRKNKTTFLKGRISKKVVFKRQGDSVVLFLRIGIKSEPGYLWASSALTLDCALRAEIDERSGSRTSQKLTKTDGKAVLTLGLTVVQLMHFLCTSFLK